MTDTKQENAPVQEEQVRIQAPDGTIFKGPKSALPKELSEGWKLVNNPAEKSAHETELEAKVAQRNDQNDTVAHKYLGLKGFGKGSDLDNIADKFLDEASFGVSGIYDKFKHKNDSPEQKELLEAQRQATEKEHPVASGAATALGFAGSLGVPGVGEIGKLAESAVLKGASHSIPEIAAKVAGEAIGQEAKTSATRKLAAAIAKNAAMGEAYSAPSQIANLTIGDPEQAAESLKWNIGLSPILGLGEFGISKAMGAAGKIAEGIKTPAVTTAMKTIDDASLEAKGIDPNKMLPTQRQDAINLLKRESNPASVIADRSQKIKEHQDFLDQADLNSNLPHSSDTARLAQEKMKEGGLASGLSTDHFDVNPAEVTNSFTKMIDDANPQLQTSPLFQDQNSQYQKILETAGKYGAAPTSFDNIRSLREAINGLPEGLDTEKLKINGSDKDLKHVFNDYLDNHVSYATNKGLNALDETDRLSQFQAQQKDLNAAKLFNDPSLQTPKLQLGQALMEAIGGVAGGAVGGLVGQPAIGAYFGSGGNPHAMKAIIKAIASKAVMPLKTAALKMALEQAPEMFGTTLAKAVNTAMDEHLSNIPKILAGAGSAPARGVPVLASMLGASAVGLTKDQQYHRVAHSLTNAQNNPGEISENLGHIMAAFGSNPALQSIAAQKNLNAITYLNSILPKNPNPPSAYTNVKDQWKPSEAQKRDFLNQLAIVDDPMVAVHKAAMGTLTAKEMNTLKTVYPVVADKIASKMTEFAFSPQGVSASNATRIAIAKAGGPIPSSLKPENMARTQQMFSAPPPEQSPNGSAPQPKHTNKNLSSRGKSMQTETQRLSNK